jgi:hypothetical protein
MIDVEITDSQAIVSNVANLDISQESVDQMATTTTETTQIFAGETIEAVLQTTIEAVLQTTIDNTTNSRLKWTRIKLSG